MRTIKEWQRAAHELAVEKGWHSRECPRCSEPGLPCTHCGGSHRVPVDPHNPMRIAASLERIHSEISEAGECNARGRMGLGWKSPEGLESYAYDQNPSDFENLLIAADGYKPEGFGIELADVFLRLCDLAESLGVELKECAPEPNAGDVEFDGSPEHIAAMLYGLHQFTSFAFEYPEHGVQDLQDLLQGLVTVAAITGVDLLAMAELKQTYNRTRSFRHGGKVL